MGPSFPVRSWPAGLAVAGSVRRRDRLSRLSLSALQLGTNTLACPPDDASRMVVKSSLRLSFRPLAGSCSPDARRTRPAAEDIPGLEPAPCWASLVVLRWPRVRQSMKFLGTSAGTGAAIHSCATSLAIAGMFLAPPGGISPSQERSASGAVAVVPPDSVTLGVWSDPATSGDTSAATSSGKVGLYESSVRSRTRSTLPGTLPARGQGRQVQ